MEKVVAFLEKHVQWLALGLGAFFLVFMAYGYLVSTPIAVDVDGRKLSPGEVDPAVATSPAMQNLKKQMSSTEVPAMPKVALAARDITSKIFEPVKIVSIGLPPPPTQPSTPVQSLASASLPAIPAPEFAAANPPARGVFTWPKSVPNKVVPGAVPGAVPVDPAVGAPGIPIPVVPVPGAAAAVMEVRDIDYVTHKWTVKLGDLAKAFDVAGIPNDPATPLLVYKTAFIGLDLIRQEKDASGQWMPETVVAVLPQYFSDQMDMPKPSDPMSVKRDFLLWSQGTVAQLIQPAFPQCVTGDPWYLPGTPPAPKIQGGPADGNGIPSGPAMPPGAMPGAMPGGVPGMMPRAGGPQVGLGGFPGDGAAGRPGLSVPGAPFNPGLPAMPGGPGMATPGVAGVAPVEPIPGTENADNGTFDPAAWTKAYADAGQVATTSLYTHDITVKPGKTYRYKVRYYLRNPLFALEDKSAKLELVQTLGLRSADSTWTAEVTIAPRVEFFVAKAEIPRGGIASETAKFDIFLQQNNQWVARSVTVSPGDQIADKDWTSGYMLVDVRKVPGKPDKSYILIADSNGRIERRDVETDQHDPKLGELRGVPAVTPGDPGLAPPPVPGIVPGPVPGGSRPDGGPRRPGPTGTGPRVPAS